MRLLRRVLWILASLWIVAILTGCDINVTVGTNVTCNDPAFNCTINVGPP